MPFSLEFNLQIVRVLFEGINYIALIMKTKLLPLFCLTLAFTIRAADDVKPVAKPKPQAFLTVESAGQDYVDQGEYTNNWGGAQVIALGDDKFRVVMHKGGLPGAGWDKSPKTEVEGKRAGEAIAFTNAANGWTYSLAKGLLTTKTDTLGFRQATARRNTTYGQQSSQPIRCRPVCPGAEGGVALHTHRRLVRGLRLAEEQDF